MEYYTNPYCKWGYCGMSYNDKVIKNKSFYNFSFEENETFSFYKLEFTSNFSMMKYINAIKNYYHKCLTYDSIDKHSYLKKWLDLKESNCDCEANLYESKVSPMLKFIHKLNLKSCGWFTFDETKCTILKKRKEKIFRWKN